MSAIKEIRNASSTVGEQPLSGESSLPDMDDRPGADVVIYDGQCNFCKAQVQRLAWFGGGRLSFVSLHDERVAERFSELSHDEMMQQMYVVTPDGRKYGGAEAVRYLSRRLPKLWLAAPILHIPFSMPLWNFLYRKIAASRYRISGSCDDGSCKIHLDR